MKHGDKAKAKSAKAASKGSVKSSKAASSSKKSSSKAGAVLKSTKQKAPAAKSAGDNGRPKVGDVPRFSNPLVAAAFKRAIKKFPTAFRRLTD